MIELKLPEKTLEKLFKHTGHLDTCLGCGYKVPTLDNGLCVDCDSPQLIEEALRVSNWRRKYGINYSDGK